MAAKNIGYHKPTGAELRAQRIAREVQPTPAEEAQRRERLMLDSFVNATRELEWLASRAAWKLLGFDTCADWWLGRVQPIVEALGLQPSADMARRIIELVQREEQALPPAQRRTQRQLAALVGRKSDWLARGSQDRSERGEHAGDDLEGTIVGPVEPDTEVEPEPLPAEFQHCENCNHFLAPPFVSKGERRCINCDADRVHVAAKPGGPCQACEADEAETHAALMERTEDASPVLGEPVEVEQPQTGAGPESDGTGLGSGPQSSPAADASTTLPHAGVPAVGAQIEEHIEDAELIRCPLCVYAVASRLVRGRPVRASLDEMLGHLQRSHDLGEDEAEDVLAARYSPAAASTPPPTAQAHPSPAPTPQQQPGPDSPTGIEGSRSETIHHTSAGVSDVGGAPEVAASVEQGLEDGGTAQDLPSSTDPDVLLRLFAEFLHALDRTDIDVLAPLLLSEEMQQLHEAADRVATFVELVERWRTK